MKKVGYILILLLLFAGCRGASKDAIMDSWVGVDESQLLSTWGSPDLISNLDNGQKIYTWKHIFSSQYGVYEGRQTFTVDPTGKVSNWSYTNMPQIWPAGVRISYRGND